MGERIAIEHCRGHSVRDVAHCRVQTCSRDCNPERRHAQQVRARRHSGLTPQIARAVNAELDACARG
eukprot:5548137-Pyramimonas_sp.AAC.1